MIVFGFIYRSVKKHDCLRIEAVASSSIGCDYTEVVRVAEPWARVLVAGGTTLVKTVPLDCKQARLRGGISGFPTFADVEPLIPAVAVGTADTDDPRVGEGFLRFVRASSHLRLIKNSDDAITDIVSAVLPGQVVETSLPSRHFFIAVPREVRHGHVSTYESHTGLALSLHGRGILFILRRVAGERL